MDLSVNDEEISEEEIGAPEKMISQRDYRPTPYADSDWEFVGERILERGFVPMVVNVLPGEAVTTDPMFEQFDAPISQGKAQMLHDPQGRSPALETAEVAAEIDEEMIEEIRQMGYAEGLAAGREEGRKDAEAEMSGEFTQLEARMKKVTEDIQTHLRSFFTRVERQSFELALSVARKILVTTAEIKPDYIVEVIAEGLKCCGSAKPIRIRLSHDDYEFIEVVGLPAQLSSSELGVTYVADDTIKTGCIIETDFGDIDLTLEKMWEQVKESLYSVAR